jgi:hypothetical protein
MIYEKHSCHRNLRRCKEINSNLVFIITNPACHETPRTCKELPGNRFENFTQNAKEDNIQLKTELINSARPVDYVILEYAEDRN